MSGEEYDAEKDFGASIDACYEAVRNRIAAGGPPWVPPSVNDFVLTPTALRVIRNLAGREPKATITRALGCTVHQLDRIARDQQISLELDAPDRVL